MRQTVALTCVFALDERDSTHPKRFLNRASQVRVLPGAQVPGASMWMEQIAALGGSVTVHAIRELRPVGGGAVDIVQQIPSNSTSKSRRNGKVRGVSARYLTRVADAELDELLPALPAMALDGAKGVGKTFTARRRASTVHPLDAPGAVELFEAEPRRMIDCEPPVLVYEWQHIPASWDLVRRAVDDDPTPGRFLLTGSAAPAGSGTHSGAGRIVRVRMRPLTLVERRVGTPGVSLVKLLVGRPPDPADPEWRVAIRVAPMNRARLTVAVLLVTALTGACSSDGDRGPETTGTPTASAAAFVTPKVGECRGPITLEIRQADSDPRPTVPCDGPHGSETAFVGDLPAQVADLPYDQAAALTGNSPEMTAILDRCDEEFERYVGVSRIVGTDAIRPINLAQPFFIPTADEWAKGARWIRCDAFPRLLEGQQERATTERLRGLGTRDPLPVAWRTCYEGGAPPPPNYEGYLSCEQAHGGEILLLFQTTDPKIDALGGDPKALEDYIADTFPQQCEERAAAYMGLSVAQLVQRGDVKVGTGTVSLARWPAEPKQRWVQCRATTRPMTGTLEGLGTRPLPPG
ncbi:hypothetical protein BH23ACT12_BH23ACT12_15260 [soil metagenome]